MRRVRRTPTLCPVACPLAAAALLLPRPAVPHPQLDPPRRRGRPRAAGRERIVCQDRLRIPYDGLLARKAAAERRVITEREVRDVTGLSYERIKAIQRGECGEVDLHEIEVLLTFFGCTLTELLQAAPCP
jgi:DNA-binding Xre family transcriptional regulator